MSADTGGSITQAAVYGKEENLCKFLKIKLKWQANNCSRFSTEELGKCKYAVGCCYTISRLTSVVRDVVWQRARNSQAGSAPGFLRGICTIKCLLEASIKHRSKSIYDGFINSLLTLDKERPICAKGLKVSCSNVAPHGTNTHTHGQTHTRTQL